MSAKKSLILSFAALLFNSFVLPACVREEVKEVKFASLFHEENDYSYCFACPYYNCGKFNYLPYNNECYVDSLRGVKSEIKCTKCLKSFSLNLEKRIIQDALRNMK